MFRIDLHSTDACKIYFPRECGQFGNFIVTGRKFKPLPPVMPKRFRQAAVASMTTTVPVAVSTTKAKAKATHIPSQAKIAAKSDSADSDHKSACALLGLLDYYFHFPNNFRHKYEIKKVLASSSGGSGAAMMADRFLSRSDSYGVRKFQDHQRHSYVVGP